MQDILWRKYVTYRASVHHVCFLNLEKEVKVKEGVDLAFADQKGSGLKKKPRPY
jgi:hypothetical protein